MYTFTKQLIIPNSHKDKGFHVNSGVCLEVLPFYEKEKSLNIK